MSPIDPPDAERIAHLALASIHREYPNKPGRVLHGDDDVLPPRDVAPIFFGSFDWHSAVHSHWALARLLNRCPAADWSGDAHAALERSFTPEGVAGEVERLGADHASFEMPYGMAWLLQLIADLVPHPEWHGILEPLERFAVSRFTEWLPRLSHPIRVGEHRQTAFAMGLVLDYAIAVNDAELRKLIETRARSFYVNDRNAPLAYEPSAHDFLSPSLAEADLLRRVMEPQIFGAWLHGFLTSELPKPVETSDRKDGKAVHFDGLNLSRAWMMQGIANALPAGDARANELRAAAQDHALAGLVGLESNSYEGTHWLGSFALYWLTRD